MQVLAARFAPILTADLVARDELNDDYIIPSVFNRRVPKPCPQAVVSSAEDSGVARGPVRA